MPADHGELDAHGTIAIEVQSLIDRGLDVTDAYLQDEMCQDVADSDEDENTTQFPHEFDESPRPAAVLGALDHEVDALDKEVEDLGSVEVEAILVPDADPAQRSGRRSPWFEARFQKVHDGGDPETDMTVIQAAFHHVEAVHKGSTIAQVEMDIKRAIARYGASCGKPAPDNPKCRYPPSYYLCKAILDVGDLSEAEVHLCPNEFCPYLTSFAYMPRAQLLHHMKSCNGEACRLCYCACGGRRMTSPGPGCSPQPQAPCYFFRDVFQQYYLDAERYAAAVDAKQHKRGNLYANPEGIRIMEMFATAGVDPDEVRLLWALIVAGTLHAPDLSSVSMHPDCSL